MVCCLAGDITTVARAGTLVATPPTGAGTLAATTTGTLSRDTVRARAGAETGTGAACDDGVTAGAGGAEDGARRAGVVGAAMTGVAGGADCTG